MAQVGSIQLDVRDSGGNDMTTFFISDMHFGDQSVMSKYDKRPFETLDEMEKIMIQRWNGRVSNNDKVYILGDMFHKSVSVEKAEGILSQLNGKKYYIIGNHEETVEKMRGEWLTRMLHHCENESIIQLLSYKDTEVLKINGWEVILSHYPMLANKNTFNANNKRIIHLYGHVHNSREETFFQLSKLARIDHKGSINKNLSLNVGCMMPYMNYTPRTLEELIDIAKEENKTLFSIQQNSYFFLHLDKQLADLKTHHDDWLLREIKDKISI